MIFFPVSAVFAVGVQPILPISAILQKEKLFENVGEKVGHVAAVCKSNPENLPVNLLQDENPFDDEYCLTISSPLAKTTFTLNNALPVSS